MSDTSSRHDEVEVLNRVLSLLNRLEPQLRKKVLTTVIAFFGNDSIEEPRSSLSDSEGSNFVFESIRDESPKSFLAKKQPRTDVERVACLAYYLTHVGGTPYFKTIEISKLNTEAAQPKFSNAANAVNNATKCGYLVPALRGNKQISAMGERFVQALPDRDQATQILKSQRTRRRTRGLKRKRNESSKQ